MGVLIYDETGAFDTMTLTQVQDSAGHLQHRQQADLSKAYDVGAKVVEVMQQVYFLDQTTRRLMYYDGYQTAVPLLENVIGLEFEYYGEPSPPMLRRPGVDQSITYGPRPPDLGVAQTGWPAGENCVVRVVDGAQTPRLATLGPPGSGLVKLTAAQLTDGPWCPNSTNGNRFDADLFRIRNIRVGIRLQTGNETLRRASSVTGGNTADPLFLNPGTSKGGYREVPDQAIRFEVSPRNLNLSR
jgi:hypothetical protein